MHNVSDPRCCYHYEEDMAIAKAVGKGAYYPGPYVDLEVEPSDRKNPYRGFKAGGGVLKIRAANLLLKRRKRTTPETLTSDYRKLPYKDMYQELTIGSAPQHAADSAQVDHIAPEKSGGVK